MRNIHLYGVLAEKFGDVVRLDVSTAAEAIYALRVNFPEFSKELREGSFYVVMGSDLDTAVPLAEEDMPGFNLGRQDLFIIPAADGRGRGGLGKIVFGIALVGLSLVPGGAALASTALWGTTTVGSLASSIGVGLVMTGVAAMISPEVESGDTTESFTMSGPVSTTKEGGIVPIAYGETYTGGSMIAGALKVANSSAVTGASSSESFFTNFDTV